jgi:serine/threonine protein phosphatase PrpC
MTSPIGVGPLRDGAPHPSGRAEYPAPYAVGTAIGEHLRVESIYRLAEGRLFVLCNNIGPKWSTRKCWSCGNAYSPDNAKCCSYCFSPLRDLRMMMTVRWEKAEYPAFEEMVRRRIRHQGLTMPLALYYRDGRMLSLYQYDGEQLLIDEAAPLPFDALIRLLHHLSRVVHFLHQNGVALRRLLAHHVQIMPDRSIRLFDPDVLAVLPDGAAVLGHPARPEAQIARDLCVLGLRLCPPENDGLRSLLEQGAEGAYDRPVALGKALYALHQATVPTLPRFPAAAYSDLGLVRSQNEDAWTWRQLGQDGLLLVVADGMGGHAAGEVASALACKTLSEQLSQGPLPPDGKALAAKLTAAFEAANRRVRALCKDDDKRMGSTLVAAVIRGKSMIIANAGDSRAYVYRAVPGDVGKLEQVSRDHTIVQDLIEAGKITKAEAKNHPRANVVTSTIGSDDDDLDVYTAEVKLNAGDRVVLCSDGLWNHVEDERMAILLFDTEDRADAVRLLVRSAYADGATDNVTAIVYDTP